ncbi:uncharacterized protein SPPG_04158 [Spizellomyces punctatus DAOM BR117]|uniref:Histidine acid phosphatase n=1 Tax=Spizellomyces punctatus (strain DAOM BR117) TaxID=645134 RepID=A0A0L0HJ08_SPIPD|nr:uncharacterized protein SPPG_04158 [Spizellomyces punctatus DAOM BR117]KND01067.1 hypothetical protein SPPG_04158 [Spizellomyces punctatus DAOM BR117]|eukprot:XP_016609106.1 hypothetical protein SPPG_04158 [Spizellomyces punctatus DAOM BR117]
MLLHICVAVISTCLGVYYYYYHTLFDWDATYWDVDTPLFPSGYNYCQAAYPSPSVYNKVPPPWTLHQLYIITRHGDRAPSTHIPTEIWTTCPQPSDNLTLPSSILPNARPILRTLPETHLWNGTCMTGQLSVRGIHQMHTLGKVFADIYGEWPVMARSTDVWRTIQGAQAFLTGLVPKGDAIPLYIYPKAVDTLSLSLVCPRVVEVYKAARRTREYKLYQERAERVAKGLSNEMGVEYRDLERWFDIVQCRSCWGKEKLGVEEEVVRLAYWWLRFEYNATRTVELGLRVGPLLDELVQTMEEGKKELYYYSAHDTTISGVLSVLGFEPVLWPPYASHLVFEVWTRGEGEKGVKVLYNGQVVDLGCGEMGLCGWQAFLGLIEKFLVVDLKKECRPV